MGTRRTLLAGLLAALLSLPALACEGGEFGGDPLEDDPGTQQDGEQDGDGGGY